MTATARKRVRCTTCTTWFTATADTEGQPEFLDFHGNRCCDTCLCRVCGYGHPTADEHENCQNEYEEGGREAVDPDLAYDLAQAALLGV